LPRDDFDYTVTKNNVVFITWRGKKAATLAGAQAARFIEAIEDASDEEAQLLMARNTGNFKRGNER